MRTEKKQAIFLMIGMLGCIFMGAGDWLMLCADPTYYGELKWLTIGVANLPQWRLNLAMFLAFPGIICYGVGLFSVENFILEDKHKKVYHYLNAFGMTPWLALHLYYVMILSLFSWLNQNGYEENALSICEALAGQMSWLIIVSELLMIPVFLYWFYLQITEKTIYKKYMAFSNVLVLFIVLEVVASFLPVSAARLGFVNGLMSESMILWFLILLLTANQNQAKAA
ncbi:MAG: hypothetical protein K5675_10840 [Lachnospiraceae bacterium]|nr:hypothetical protein [Lachnospiraceae bacterium]